MEVGFWLWLAQEVIDANAASDVKRLPPGLSLSLSLSLSSTHSFMKHVGGNSIFAPNPFGFRHFITGVKHFFCCFNLKKNERKLNKSTNLMFGPSTNPGSFIYTGAAQLQLQSH